MTRQSQRYAMPGDGPTDEDLEHEVELTRRELSETVAELAHKVNVKARVEQRTRRTVDRMRVLARRHRPALAVASGSVALATVGVILLLMRRR